MKCVEGALLTTVGLLLISPARIEAQFVEWQEFPIPSQCYFGNPLSMSESYAFVGKPTPDFSGVVEVYARDSALGTWTKIQELSDSSPTAGVGFGSAVSVDGNVALIAAPGSSPSGSASIYHFDPTLEIWVEEQQLSVATASPGDAWGHSVSLCGDLAVISSREASRAVVFRYDPTLDEWLEEQELAAPPTTSAILYGETVAVSEGWIAVSSVPFVLGGSVTLFRYDSTTASWIESQNLSRSGRGYDEFGASLALEGDVLVIGVPNDRDYHFADFSVGSAYVYRLDPTLDEWIEEQRLGSNCPVPAPCPDPMDPPGGAYFGWAVDMTEDRIVVGAPNPTQTSGPPHPLVGMAHVYRFDATDATWRKVQTLQASNGLEFNYGIDVAASDHSILITAPGHGNDSCDVLPAAMYFFRQPSFLRGDANGDGSVDLSDPNVTFEFLFLAGSIHCPDALDCNDDGDIDLADPIYSWNYQFAGGPEPLAPFPGCDRDPTDDSISCLDPHCP